MAGPMLNALPPVAGQAPAAATDATVTLAAVPNAAWKLSGILYSYTATPAVGQLLITWGANTITLAVPAAGPGQITFPDPLRFPVNTAVTVTLKSGGGTVVGTVYPLGTTS